MKYHNIMSFLKLGANNCIHSDSRKHRSSFLVALLSAAGDADRYAK